MLKMEITFSVAKQAPKVKNTFDENDQKEFLKGAKIACNSFL